MKMMLYIYYKCVEYIIWLGVYFIIKLRYIFKKIYLFMLGYLL